MRIALTGASGFIGKHLSGYFTGQGYEVVPLGRSYFQKGTGELTGLLSDADIVINLMGAPINRRWTPAYKQMLYDSRIATTRMLVNAINRTSRVRLFISASAVGYYSARGCHDEYNGVKGDGFLSDLCEAWETEARRVRSSIRTIVTRFGIVLASDGGAFLQLARPARMGIAAIVASGKQPFAWIGLMDLMGAMRFIMEHPELEGVFNFVAPEQISNGGFIRNLSCHYHSLSTIKVPAFVFRLLYGEGAGFLTQGQCVAPRRLLESGYHFQQPTAGSFLVNL